MSSSTCSGRAERRGPSSTASRRATPARSPFSLGCRGAFTRGVNESGWLADEVVAAGVLRQGKAPSLAALVTGAALVDVLRPRPSKSLPREFALAVTADR